MDKIVIISLGGSVVAPVQGIDVKFLKEFKDLIVAKIKLGYKFIIIVGGGNIAREYISASKSISTINNNDSDWLGIAATVFNAQLLKTIFIKYAYPGIIINPTKKIRTRDKIIIGAGYKPGWSTDYDAVLLAKTYKVKEIINLSNIDYVYDRDPRKYRKANKLQNITWKEFKKIIGNKWQPGLNSPFDPIASKLASQEKLKVLIINGKRLKSLDNYLQGKQFIGTTIY